MHFTNPIFLPAMRSIRTSKIETFRRKIETFLDGVSYLIEIQKKEVLCERWIV